MPNHQSSTLCYFFFGEKPRISRKIASVGSNCYALDNDEQMGLMLDLFAFILLDSIRFYLGIIFLLQDEVEDEHSRDNHYIVQCCMNSDAFVPLDGKVPKSMFRRHCKKMHSWFSRRR